jgi:uncharacterized protein (DUF2267 family)
MHREDLVSQVRARARLHGRNQAGRVIRAVLQASRPLVPEPAFRQLVDQLPSDLADLPAHGDASPSLIDSVARALHVDRPNAAFLARVVFEQLNSFCRGVTPATIAPSLPAEVRPLFTARADDPAQRYRSVFPAWGTTSAGLNLRAGALVDSGPVVPAELSSAIPAPARASSRKQAAS